MDTNETRKRNKEIPPCCFSVRVTPKPLSHLGALRMEGGSGAAHRPWDTASQLQYSFRTSVSSLSEVEEEEASPPPVAVEDRVFVAVPEDAKNGKSTLLWALENPAKDCAGVVVAHVHCPAQMIPMSKVPFRRRWRGCCCCRLCILGASCAKGNALGVDMTLCLCFIFCCCAIAGMGENCALMVQS